MKRRAFTFASLAVGLTQALSGSVLAQETKIRFTLDWKYQGIHAFVFWAEAKGYFKAEGLNVEVDQGSGSAATISKIASGSYDAGLGDMNAIIQMAGAKPGEQPVMVYMMYNRPPFALITKASGPIKTLADLPGKTLGTPVGAAAGQLFGSLAKLNNIDASKVAVTNMAPNLQEQMLLNGQVDVSAVFSVTSYMNLASLKIDPDKDIRWFFYSDFGIDLYSNGVMVSQKLLKDNPKAVAGLVKALNRALIEVAADPDAAIALIAQKEPLLNVAIEKQRLLYAYKTHFVSPETDEIGIGDIKPDRMAKAIKLLAETYEMPKPPQVEAVFNRSFMPPKEARVLKMKM